MKLGLENRKKQVEEKKRISTEYENELHEKEEKILSQEKTISEKDARLEKQDGLIKQLKKQLAICHPESSSFKAPENNSENHKENKENSNKENPNIPSVLKRPSLGEKRPSYPGRRASSGGRKPLEDVGRFLSFFFPYNISYDLFYF